MLVPGSIFRLIRDDCHRFWLAGSSDDLPEGVAALGSRQWDCRPGHDGRHRRHRWPTLPLVIYYGRHLRAVRDCASRAARVREHHGALPGTDHTHPRLRVGAYRASAGIEPPSQGQICSNLDLDRPMRAALSRIDRPAARSAVAASRALVPSSSLARRSSRAARSRRERSCV